MKFEHLIYSIAFAILIYTIYKKKYVLSIIILSAYSPDLDIIADSIFKQIGITLLVYGEPIRHGNFHNILVLLLYSIFVALILNTIKSTKLFNHIKLISFKDSFILAGMGFGAHLLEDAIVYNPGYRFFWPISDKIYGIGLFDYKVDFYGIADTQVLLWGIFLVIISLTIFLIREGKILKSGDIVTNVKKNGRI